MKVFRFSIAASVESLQREVCAHLRSRHPDLWRWTIAQLPCQPRNERERDSLKALGFQRGVPHVLILAPRGTHHCLAITIVEAGRQPSDAELRFLERFGGDACANWVNDLAQARELIEAYARLQIGETCDVLLHVAPRP